MQQVSLFRGSLTIYIPEEAAIVADDQVNDPTTCPIVTCRNPEFTVTEVQNVSTDGGSTIRRCVCDECGCEWSDEYRTEFIQRKDVTRA